MIKLIHNNAKSVNRVTKEGESLKVLSEGVSEALWELAEKFADEIIIWCEEEFEDDLNTEALPEIFHHDLIMASYALKTDYLPNTIGYIGQLPFVNVNREVQYATWRMSTDVGGIKAKVLLQFREMFRHIKDFGFLLNSIAKLGQQNGLFCYSAPGLIKEGEAGLRPFPYGEAQPDILRPLPSRQAQPDNGEGLKSTASKEELFSFVHAHYKSVRLWLLFWCFLRYEKSFPLGVFITALFQEKYFKKDIDLSEIELRSNRKGNPGTTIDVIIPTLGRKQYLLQVLEDLKVQSLLPKKVIVVEQNPVPDSQSELPELQTQSWPFEVVHHFTNKTGACHARNLALEEVESDWVFFNDDDNRIGKNVLRNALQEIKRIGVDLLTLQYSQKGEELIFDKIKQWGTFGAGNSIVAGKFASKIKFDEAYEYGYAEDKDYGMQLRNAGCDIIYHPDIEILHLKAPRGGFREIDLPPWEQDKPKPSPTLMIYAKKYYTPEQLKGFKAELFLRYYFRQEIRNPFKYLKRMKESWRKSEDWAEKMKQEVAEKSH